jgi:predicted RNA-binding Zn-ribbon protein involved in translation (DUF1610 family)
MSLDGFIAGSSGEADWIIMDPEIDFKAIYSQFDTMVLDAPAGRVLGRHAVRRWNDGRGDWSCRGWAAVGHCRAGPALGLAIRG